MCTIRFRIRPTYAWNLLAVIFPSPLPLSREGRGVVSFPRRRAQFRRPFSPCERRTDEGKPHAVRVGKGFHVGGNIPVIRLPLQSQFEGTDELHRQTTVLSQKRNHTRSRPRRAKPTSGAPAGGRKDSPFAMARMPAPISARRRSRPKTRKPCTFAAASRRRPRLSATAPTKRCREKRAAAGRDPPLARLRATAGRKLSVRHGAD